MDAYSYLSKHTVGQDQLKPELAILMEEIKLGNNFNIMFRGSSGYGKTHLANVVCNYVNIDVSHMFLGEELFDFIGKRRLNILDEIHEVKNPEYIYPYMDVGSYTFLICTNEFGNLKEPLVNRCIVFDLRNYSLDELTILIKQVFKYHRMEVSIYQCKIIASYSRGNPRVAKILAKRLAMLFRRIRQPDDREELVEFLKIYFDLDNGGFNHYDRQYLDFLRTNRRASLATLSSVLCIPQGTLLNEIEPFLIREGLIQITPRGRIYIGDN